MLLTGTFECDECGHVTEVTKVESDVPLVGCIECGGREAWTPTPEFLDEVEEEEPDA